MNGRKKVLLFLLLAVLLAAVALGIVWHMINYVMVDFRFYPRNARTLDLRDQEITVNHYERLQRMLPDCQIHWNVPFQDSLYPEDTSELTVKALTDKDVRTLKCFSSLRVLNAQGCTDYQQLIEAQEQYPQVEVRCTVSLGGNSYSNQESHLELRGIASEEVQLLDCFPNLETVVACGGAGTENYHQVQEYCQDNDLEFLVGIGGKELPTDQASAELTGVTQEEMGLLELLPDLKQVHFVLPEASGESLTAYRDANAQIQITWEQEICGKRFSLDTEEIDLSDATIKSLEQVELGMTYFPDSQRVFLGECAFENDDIAAYRERVREDYKVVWTVRFGGVLPTRTDTTDFFPARDNCPLPFTDKISYNLRYCEDIVCMDIGHHGGITDVSFLAYMPNIEYLILAHTSVQYIDAISNCKKLKFLELDWSAVKDLAPLAGCTSLEDLNFGNTWPKVDGILGMTWLKNVYMIFGSSSDAYRISQALPDTKVVTSGNATVASGWRKLPNYYAMRDYLGVPYMNG